MSRFDDDPAFFGELWAEDYDDYPGPDPGTMVEFLAGLAGDGRVLELAIGTGRVALPLAALGVAVEGIEGSEAMAAKLHAKPGGDAIPVAIGDMADVRAQGPFRLVYLVFNTLFNLTSAERQLDCFRNVARVLEPGGAFVIETYVPDQRRFDRDQQVEAVIVTEDSVVLEAFSHDAAAQRYLSQKIFIDGKGVRLRPHSMRYAWPSELDLMARIAGLRLDQRYADWDRRPFGSDSQRHASVYRLA